MAKHETITVPVELQPIVGQLEHTVEDQYTSFAQREPVVLGHVLAAPVATTLSYLVEHGVIGSSTASDKQTAIVSALVFAAVTLQGFVLRRYVSPAWKHLTGHDLPEIEPTAYGDAYDDGTGVPEPAAPPVSRRSPDDPVDETTGVITGSQPRPAPPTPGS